MKLILLNGSHGTGRDEAAKQFCNAMRGPELHRALVWPIAYIGTRNSLAAKNDVEYVVIPDVDNPEHLIRAVEFIGIENVCLVNVFRQGYEDEGIQPLGYDRQRPGERLEHLDYNLYNDGPLEALGEALARIVEVWEAGATFVEKHTGA